MDIRQQLDKGLRHTRVRTTRGRLAPLRARTASVGKATSRTMDRILPARRRRARRRAMVTGVGAAAMALPVGIWLGRRYLESRG